MASLPALVDALLQRHLDLAWEWWTEMGVPGARHTAAEATVHPEALVVFTASLIHHDARLREGVIGWLLAHGHLLGSRQVLAVANRLPAVPAGVGDFTATLAQAGGPKWAGHHAGTPIVGNYIPLTRPPRLDRPSMALLRLRAALGVHARSEVLAVLGGDGAPTLAHGTLSGYIASTPRNVRLALDDLVSAGVVTTAGRPGATRYRCADAQALKRWIGPIPDMPPWVTVLPAFAALRRALTDEVSPIEQAVRVRQMVDHHAAALARLDIPPPPTSSGRDLSPAVAQWLLDVSSSLQHGRRAATGPL